MSKLLVVDDEQTICWGLTRLGESIGHEVMTASSAEQALQVVDQIKPDVIVLDVRLPGMDGLTALEKFRQRLGDVPIVVITAYGDLRTAVQAVRNGAFEYIVKPFDLEQMERVLRRAREVAYQEDRDGPVLTYVGGLVGRTPAMQRVFKKIALAATSKASVMLCGESGTGKELAARAIHQFSDRSAGPFVAVNVASLNSALAEGELFGHVRGAFTGADVSRAGLLARANGGTLFLDEVADIPLAIQVKLLRALDHGEVLPVGASETVNTDFRVVSATHQSLVRRVRERSFRHDLYFRLCGFQIDMPPLREHREDIQELAEHFLNGLASEPGRSRLRFPDETLAVLQRRPWYGNVRELRNTIDHAALLARGGIILPEHLPPPASPSLVASSEPGGDDEGEIVIRIREWVETKLAGGENTGELHRTLLRLVEPPLLEVTLEKHENQCLAAARVLGLHRTTLRKKLRQYGLGEDRRST